MADLSAVLRSLVKPISIQLAEIGELLADTQLYEFPAHHARIGVLDQSAVVVSSAELPIELIVARAAYVHSGGPLIAAQPWAEVDTDKIEVLCRSYLLGLGHNSAELIFYTQSNHSADHDPGDLAGLRIDDKRFHLGDKPFRWEAERLKRALQGDQAPGLVIYAYHDRATVSGSSGPSYLSYPDRDVVDYLVMYHSAAKRENPVQRLDEYEEGKPFWAGIFTTPHRLVNAMLNLGGVESDSVILDPFAYTGTVAIEAARFGATVISYDIAEVKGAQDNFDFFCGETIASRVNALSALLANPSLLRSLLALAKEHARLNRLGLPDIREEDRIESLLSDQSRKNLLREDSNRLFYYLLRRYVLELARLSGPKVVPEEQGARDYVRKKLDRLGEAGGYLGALDSAERHPMDARIRCVPVGVLSRSHAVDFDRPSPRVHLSYCTGRTDRERFTFDLNDIRQGIPKPDNSVDVVVTDPPYGYGDDLGHKELWSIYLAFFENALRVLRNGGSLVFCALDKIKTGRPTVNLLTTQEVVAIANAVAAKQRVEFGFPSIEPSFGQAHGLYFWKSPKALNRCVFATRVYKRD